MIRPITQILETTLKHMQEESDQSYRSYMLRMWLRRDSKGELAWRATLQDPGSRHIHTFADIPTMYSFLQNTLEMDLQGSSVPQYDQE